MGDGVESIAACALGMVTTRKGNVVMCSKTRNRMKVCAVLNRWASENVPKGFTWTTIQLNLNYASKPHVDGNNRGPSQIIGLGDYKGGEMLIWGLGKVDIKDKWTEFNGTHWHQTYPFPTGSRYSFVFFSINKADACTPEVLKELKGVGFPGRLKKNLANIIFMYFLTKSAPKSNFFIQNLNFFARNF